MEGIKKSIWSEMTLGGWAIIGVVSLIFIWFISPFQTISAHERGVVLRFGEINRVMEPGLHLRWPIAESVKILNTGIVKDEVPASGASNDMQDVNTTVAVNYHVNPAKVTDIWVKFQGQHANIVVAPAIQETTKAVTAKYTAAELITKRPEVSEAVIRGLRERLELNDLILDSVSITDFQFSDVFKTAIETKVTAEQSALTAKNKLEQVKFEAEQRVTSAKAEAEAIKIQAQAIQQQGGKEYVQLKFIEAWNGALPLVSGSGGVPILNIPESLIAKLTEPKPKKETRE
jgi:regulator of protease activity HflC (stomatin/prohibitin superfamily)